MHPFQKTVAARSTTLENPQVEISGYSQPGLPVAPNTIPALLSKRVELSPAKPAYYSEHPAANWAPTRWMEYYSRVNQLAESLFRAGLRKGDVLAIAAPTCFEWELFSMACWQIGGVVLGVDLPITGRSWQTMAESKVRALVVDDIHQIADLDLSKTELAFIATLVERSESQLSVPVFSLASLCDAEKKIRTKECTELPEFPSADDPAIIVYTSGTTGTSKGIVYSHRQLILAVEGVLAALQLDESDVGLCWLPLSALFQRMVNLIAMACGASLYFIEDPTKMIGQLESIKPTFLIGVPKSYEKLRQFIEIRGSRGSWITQAALKWMADNLQTLSKRPITNQLLALVDQLLLKELRATVGGRIKFMLTGSAPMPVTLIDWFNAVGLPVLEGYGLSENVIPMAMNTSQENRVGSVGKLLKANSIRFDDDSQIYVKGPGVFNGYLNDGTSSLLFTEDGYYRTGDFGRIDEEGFLYLDGRKSDLVKSSAGRKLPLVHIESEYRRLRYIEDVLTIGAGRPYVIALLTINLAKLGQATGESLAPDAVLPPQFREIINQDVIAIGENLAQYQRIRGFALLKHPFAITRGELTNNGKLRRKCIEENYGFLIEMLYRHLDDQKGKSMSHELCHFIQF